MFLSQIHHKLRNSRFWVWGWSPRNLPLPKAAAGRPLGSQLLVIYLGAAFGVLRKPAVHTSEVCPQTGPRGRGGVSQTSHTTFRRASGEGILWGPGTSGRGSQAEKLNEGRPLLLSVKQKRSLSKHQLAGRSRSPTCLDILA